MFEKDLVIGTWAAEPLEKLNNTLQHAESTSKCMLDAVYSRGPVWDAEVELHRRAVSSPETFYPLSFLTHHFEQRDDVDEIEMEREAFAKINEMSKLERQASLDSLFICARVKSGHFFNFTLS